MELEQKKAMWHSKFTIKLKYRYNNRMIVPRLNPSQWEWAKANEI